MGSHLPRRARNPKKEFLLVHRPLRPMGVCHFSPVSRWSSVDLENEGRSEAGRSAVHLCWVATGLISRPVPSKGIQSPSRYPPLLRLPWQARYSVRIFVLTSVEAPP